MTRDMMRALWQCCRGPAFVALFGAVMLGDARIARADIEIDARYPGGNIVVERIEGDHVYLRPDLRDTNGWWFYWSFRVQGAAERTLTFHFTGRNPIGVRGPAVSSDGGRSWSWLGRDRVEGASFAYAFPADQDEVRFCFAIPYQEEDLRKFLASHRDGPHLSVQELCKSRKGRSIERLHVGAIDKDPKHRIRPAPRLRVPGQLRCRGFY